jgi:hypothetical protein
MRFSFADPHEEKAHLCADWIHDIYLELQPNEST